MVNEKKSRQGRSCFVFTRTLGANMNLKVLTKDLLEIYLEQILSIETQIAESLEKKYDNRQWSDKEFLFDLPGKWEFSLIALDANQVLGFLIH